MVWILIILSAILLWFVSLAKIIRQLPHASVDAFVNEGISPRNIMLLIAHPDDESMFFTPTINYLISRGHNIYILCISTGDADGLGSIRKNELYLASALLKISPHQVKILDHPDLQDGFGKTWNWDLLAKIIGEEAHANSIDMVVTFDNYGISGHPNHCDLNHGVRKLLRSDSGKNLQAWELVSNNIVHKYIGPVGIWLSLHNRLVKAGRAHCLLNRNPLQTYTAMAQHSSQWVWFRKLFVALSSYTYCNTLKKLE